MKITFYGHNCLGLEIKGKHILVDPFISGNELAKDKVNMDEIKADYILLTHAHSDHTLDVDAIAKRTNAVIVSNFEITTYYEDRKSTRLNSSHVRISYAVFCLKKKSALLQRRIAER